MYLAEAMQYRFPDQVISMLKFDTAQMSSGKVSRTDKISSASAWQCAGATDI